jgi:hypothetical protein
MGYGGTILIPRSPHGELNIIKAIESRRMRLVGQVGRLGDMRKAYSISVTKPKGKRSFGRHRRRGENIRTDLREITWEYVDWMHLAHDWDQWWDLLNTVIKLLVP